jgi:hypothetical protein
MLEGPLSRTHAACERNEAVVIVASLSRATATVLALGNAGQLRAASESGGVAAVPATRYAMQD